MHRPAAFVLGLAALLAITATWVAVDPAPEARDLLVNRAWIDRMPKDKKDLVTYFIPLSIRKKLFGVAQRASHYAFMGERFTYTRDGDKLTLTFQQTERRVVVNAKAYDCKGKAPEPFDLCLDLQVGKQKAKFFSKKSWKVPGKIEGLPAFDLSPFDAEPCPACQLVDEVEYLR